MRKFFYNKILLLAIAAGLIASLVIAGQRHAVEINNSQVDMAMDFDSIKNLSEREGLDFKETLQQFKDAGITSLAIYDTTFEKLTRAGKVIAVYGADIISNYHSGALTDYLWREAVEMGAIDATRVYIIGRTLESYEAAKKDLFLRYGENRVRSFSLGEIEILEVKAQFGAFMSAPLGIDKEELEIAKKAGFMILARPKNFNKLSLQSWKVILFPKLFLTVRKFWAHRIILTQPPKNLKSTAILWGLSNIQANCNFTIKRECLNLQKDSATTKLRGCMQFLRTNSRNF